MPRPVHFEIPANDIPRATKFFTDVFGWQFQGWGDGNYQMATTGETEQPGINGAIFKRTDPKQPVVNSIDVTSVDDYVTRVQANGGTIIMAKQPIPGMGYYATFQDTEGNVHGLWQSDKNAK